MAKPVPIERPEQVDELIRASHERPILLLKHSTRCPVSAEAYRRFLSFAGGLGDAAALPALLLVVEHRAASDAVAERLEVEHESPQALLIAAGRVTWHASHHEVNERSLGEALAAAA